MYKLKNMHILISFFFFFVASGQFAPNWLTSNYLQTGFKKVIDGDLCGCKTGSTSTPTSTLTFTTAFTVLPNLGYGMTSYQGNLFFNSGDDLLYN